MVKSDNNPGGTPIEVFDGFRTALAANRSQFYLDVASGPFYNFNRPGVERVEALIRNWWRQGMMGGANAGYDCIKVFSETDLTEDLMQINAPVLVIHRSMGRLLIFSIGAGLTGMANFSGVTGARQPT
jgi:non-heme chloroperoxidase